MTAAGLADLMRAQYETDPNSAKNTAEYYGMWDKGQGRQIEQANSAETGRHNLATEGTSAATLAQTTKHEITKIQTQMLTRSLLDGRRRTQRKTLLTTTESNIKLF